MIPTVGGSSAPYRSTTRESIHHDQISAGCSVVVVLAYIVVIGETERIRCGNQQIIPQQGLGIVRTIRWIECGIRLSGCRIQQNASAIIVANIYPITGRRHIATNMICSGLVAGIVVEGSDA